MYFTKGQWDYCYIKPSSHTVIGAKKDGKITEYKVLPKWMVKNRWRCGFWLPIWVIKSWGKAYYSNWTWYCEYKQSEQVVKLNTSGMIDVWTIPDTMVSGRICWELTKLPNNCSGWKIFHNQNQESRDTRIWKCGP